MLFREILYSVWKIQILKLYFGSDGALANQTDNLFNYLANATLNKALIFHFKPLAALCEKDLVTTLKDFFFQSHAELNEQVWEFESEVRQKSCISFGALLDWRLIVQSHEHLTWLSLQGTSGYSSRSTWQKASVLAAPTVRKPVPGISNFSPAPPVAQSSTSSQLLGRGAMCWSCGVYRPQHRNWSNLLYWLWEKMVKWLKFMLSWRLE